MQKTSLSAFIQFLEDEKRLDEVVALFSSKPDALSFETRFEFFKRHKKAYPEAAKRVFEQALNKNLPDTGDRAYRAVTEALKQLKAVEPAGAFQARIAAIRGEYKRRTKLMEMLERAAL